MQCNYIKENKELCQANAMKDGLFCYLHNPDISDEEKKLAQVKGGKGNIVKLDESLPEIKVDKAKDVVLLLEDTVNKVRSGAMDIRIANTIGYLCGHLIKAIEVAEIEKRVTTVERVILERSSR
ncbi:MAG TPA: hypothetical protein VK338_00735 [Candidatus Nitrosocosmicus sp.]|nr:hypothetical protein [Candidatus Nitrosocosmicus sp.]